MAAPARGPGSGLIKNPSPSRTEIIFYTVMYICVSVILWPFMLLGFLYSVALSGPRIGCRFFMSHYYSCLYGE